MKDKFINSSGREKKILILATVGGFLSQFELDDVRILQEMGYTVYYAADLTHPVYSLKREALEEIGIHLHQISITKSPLRLVQNGKALREVIQLIRREKIQALHCHTPTGGLIGRLAGLCCGRKMKVVYTAHGFHFYQGAPQPGAFVYHTVEKLLARFTDILIVINEEDRQSAEKFHLRKNGQVFRIPGVGLDMERFAPFTEEERAAGRRKLGLNEEDFFLLSVGELNENKNQHTVLLALARMRRDGKDVSHIRYGICGDGVNRRKLEEEIKLMGLSDIVKIYGYQSPVQLILGCADAFIFPSRREGLGIAALEALSMGIPVIAADNRGTREYMQPGKNGFVCGWNDTDGYVRGIEAVQFMGQKQKKEIKQFCRESVKGFAKENTHQIMWDVYRRMDEITEEDK